MSVCSMVSLGRAIMALNYKDYSAEHFKSLVMEAVTAIEKKKKKEQRKKYASWNDKII